MYGRAFIKDGLLWLHPDESLVGYSEMGAMLGDSIVAFSYIPESAFRDVFGQFRKEFLSAIKDKKSDKAYYNTIDRDIRLVSHINSYLNIYLSTYYMYLISLRGGLKEATEVLQGLIHNGYEMNLDALDKMDFEESSQYAIDLLISDIAERQRLLKNDFAVITGEMEDVQSLTPMQRLYLLSLQGRNYLSCEFKMKLSPDSPHLADYDSVKKAKSALLKNDVDIVEMVEIKDLDDLLSFELYHTIKSNLILRKCKYCGEYFIVHGRVDTEYCNRIKEGETKPCSEIGAARNYWNDKEGNSIYAEFQQAYKRNHSRRRVGKMTKNEFIKWSEEARNKRAECEDGKLTVKEFRQWLGNQR